MVEDYGMSFCLGYGGAAPVYFISSLFSGPHGGKLRYAFQQASIKGPRSGMGFAGWGVSIGTIECVLQKVRSRDDSLNLIVAGLGTGFLLSGPGMQRRVIGGAVGGLLFAAIEGIQWAMMRGQQRLQSDISGGSETAPSSSSFSHYKQSNRNLVSDDELFTSKHFRLDLSDSD